MSIRISKKERLTGQSTLIIPISKGGDRWLNHIYVSYLSDFAGIAQALLQGRVIVVKGGSDTTAVTGVDAFTGDTSLPSGATKLLDQTFDGKHKAFEFYDREIYFGAAGGLVIVTNTYHTGDVANTPSPTTACVDVFGNETSQEGYKIR